MDKKGILSGGYFIDPLLIAKAWKGKFTPVTEEENRADAARISNICGHFEFYCINLEEFLTEMNF